MALTVTSDVAALRADLAPHTVESIAELIGPVAVAALEREQSVPALRATDAGGPGVEPGSAAQRTAGSDASAAPRVDASAALRDASAAAVLLRLFVLGTEVTRAQLDRALPRTGTAGSARLGLVEAAGGDADDAVRALVDLQPYATQDAAGTAAWWLASDRGELATGRSLRPDHVLGVGGASLTLARATVRDPRRRVLDLGTGCGIQALHATRHSAAVVGTDVSARALRFAAFNAALAGVAIELREGSMLEPVVGETFDLVVSNPPFVITPRAAGGVPRFEYRDGGLAGDAVVRDLVTGVGAVLEPGGVAQLLANWEHRRGQDWRDRVGEWLDAAGLDAWVVQREVLDPAEYAETWLRDGGATSDRDPVAWESGYRAWLEDFEARDVEAVGFGLVVLRRPAQDGARPSLRRLEDVRSPVARPLGEHVASVLRAHDWLTRHDDAALADARLVVAPDVVEDRHHTPGAADPALVRLRQGDGFTRAVTVGTAVAAVVGACDGDLAVGSIIGAVAGLLGRATADVTAEVLPVVRDLLLDGFLRVE